MVVALALPVQFAQAFSETAETETISITSLSIETPPVNSPTTTIITEDDNENQTNTTTLNDTIPLDTSSSTDDTTSTTVFTSSTPTLISTSTDPIDTDDTTTTIDTNTSTLEITTTTPNETPTTTITSTTDTNINNTTTLPNNTGGTNTSAQEVQKSLISSVTIQDTINKILNFFRSNQSTNGLILDGGTSGWVAMSFSANNIYSDTIKNSETDLASALKQYNFSDTADLNLCAAYPRQILALDALGDSRTTASTKILVQKIKEQCFANGIYGQNGINDDVFGLIALLAHDEPANSTQIKTIISSIESDQTSDGAFTWAGYAGADITGAAINSLIYARNRGATIKESAIIKAKNYLKSTQLTDGGWNSGWGEESEILTTSWAVMGIDALGEGQAEWFKDAKNPWYVLTEKIAGKEYYESAWAPGPDWFAMKHAVPALAGKSWPTTITQRIFSETPPTNSTGNSTNPEVISPTTTLVISTTTVETFLTTSTTSTPNLIIATSTIIITNETTTNTIPSLTTTTIDKIQKTKQLMKTKKNLLPKNIAGEKITSSTTTASPTTPATSSTNTVPKVGAVIQKIFSLIFTGLKSIFSRR